MQISGIYIFFVVMAIILGSCGSKVETTEIKEFRISLAEGDVKLVPLLKFLTKAYNEQSGIAALDYVDSPDQANSRIFLVEGLEQRDGKVGWGQWFAESETSGVNLPGSKVDKKTKYTLQVEFDAAFFREHSRIMDNGQPDIDVMKLFSHEIGHGFQMEHHPDKRDVMYFDVTGDKNFSSYWPRVRAFFNN